LTIALVLIVASALVGIATGYVFRVWALVLISPFIAVFSAIILRANEFGMVGGVTVIAICLAVCQLAYLAAAYVLHARDASSHDEIDGEPGETSEQKIRRQHKSRQSGPKHRPLAAQARRLLLRQAASRGRNSIFRGEIATERGLRQHQRVHQGHFPIFSATRRWSASALTGFRDPDPEQD
jgi:hypothetical protein